VSAWLKRFGLHLAAAVGATGIFVAAAAVGASQHRPQDAAVVPIPAAAIRTPLPPRKPSVAATPSPAAGSTGSTRRPAASNTIRPERSLAGTVREVLPDVLVATGVGGREWRIAPAPGALIRLNGRTAKLETLQPGDSVVILGQAQPNQGPGRFLAHAITARRK
jgi:hypothetical protein